MQRIESGITRATLVLAVAVSSLCTLQQARAAEPDKLVERGRYIVTVSACHDCHTPFKPGPNGPEPDMSRMLSGHPESVKVPAPPAPKGPWDKSFSDTNTAWSGPWGVSFTANLTPDPETGIGKWSFRNFADTIRSGKHLGRGRDILPPMPWPMYANFTDEDLKAIYTFLQSIPPVRNRVPQPLPPATEGPK